MISFQRLLILEAMNWFFSHDLFKLENFRWIWGHVAYVLQRKKKSIYGIILILSGHLLDCSQIANE